MMSTNPPAKVCLSWLRRCTYSLDSNMHAPSVLSMWGKWKIGRENTPTASTHKARCRTNGSTLAGNIGQLAVSLFECHDECLALLPSAIVSVKGATIVALQF